MKRDKRISQAFGTAQKSVRGAGKAATAGAISAALLAGSVAKDIKNKAVEFGDSVLDRKNKKTGEVIEMKKSTLVILLVALATVAGVLGALYFYVLRREKELDEYEQLLFSEDFNDDLPGLDDDLDEENNKAES